MSLWSFRVADLWYCFVVMIKKILNNIKKLLTKEQSNILSASVGMMFLLLLTKFLGLFTKTVAVTRLGAGKYGIFVVANILPEMLSMILIFGSITSVIIPILVEEIQKNGKNSFTRLFSSLANAGLLSFTILATIVIFTADDITPFVIENFARPLEPYSTEEMAQISSMMRYLMIPQIILGISTFISSALNAHKRFIVPQLAPLFYNIGILFGAAVLIPLMGGSAWGLTWGSLLGAFLHLLIQLPLSTHLKVKYQFALDIVDKKLRQVIFIAFPRILALAADQIAIAIDKVIALGLGKAPVGAYQLAVSLVTVPYSLFSGTFSVASLPHLASQFARKKPDKFKRTFSDVFNQILFLTVPVTMILLVLRLPIVRLFYGIFGQEFTWENTLMVSWVVFFLSVGLIPEVLYSFISRAFYATKDTVRPLIVGVFVMVGGIISGIYFTRYFSHFEQFSLKVLSWNPEFFTSKEEGIAAVGGLALSSSVIYTLAFIFLLIFLTRKVGKLPFKEFYLRVIRKLVFGVIMAVFMYLLFKMWDGVLDTARTINLSILTISTIIPGISIYLWLSYIFHDPETQMIGKITSTVKKIVKR
jgi:putative peptidoglycan lipid II flippase